MTTRIICIFVIFICFFFALTTAHGTDDFRTKNQHTTESLFSNVKWEPCLEQTPRFPTDSSGFFEAQASTSALKTFLLNMLTKSNKDGTHSQNMLMLPHVLDEIYDIFINGSTSPQINNLSSSKNFPNLQKLIQELLTLQNKQQQQSFMHNFGQEASFSEEKSPESPNSLLSKAIDFVLSPFFSKNPSNSQKTSNISRILQIFVQTLQNLHSFCTKLFLSSIKLFISSSIPKFDDILGMESKLSKKFAPKIGKTGQFYEETFEGKVPLFKISEKNSISPLKFNLEEEIETISTLRDNEEKPKEKIAQCSYIEVPLNWEDQEKDPRKIKIFVKKFLSPKPRNQVKGALILLQGGPGGDSTVFERFWRIISSNLNNDYDLILPDHRGTGRSNFFACSSETGFLSMLLQARNPETISKCYSEATDRWNPQHAENGMKVFGVSAAAHDISHLIKILRSEASDSASYKAIVYSVSYGTYLLNRLLQLHPTDVDSAIADSIVAPPFDFFDWDQHFIEAGDHFIEICESDSTGFCSTKFRSFGGLNESFIRAVVRQSPEGSDFRKMNPKYGDLAKCHSMIGPNFVRRITAMMMVQPVFRKIVFPIIFRLNRCSGEDLKWLDNVYAYGLLGRLNPRDSSISPTTSEKPSISAKTSISSRSDDTDSSTPPSVDQYVSQFSFPWQLYRTIVCSELAKKPYPTVSEKYAPFLTGKLPPFFFGQSAEQLINHCENSRDPRFQLYSEDPMSAEMSRTYNGSLLAMNGNLDTQTPFNQAFQIFGKHYVEKCAGSENTTNCTETLRAWISVPNGGHGVTFSTPMKNKPEEICGINILTKFIKSGAPGAISAASECIKDWEDFNFNFRETNSELTTSFLFWDDLWEGGPSISILDILNYCAYFVILLVILSTLIGFCGICCCSSCWTLGICGTSISILNCCCNSEKLKRRKLKKRIAEVEFGNESEIEEEEVSDPSHDENEDDISEEDEVSEASLLKNQEKK